MINKNTLNIDLVKLQEIGVPPVDARVLFWATTYKDKNVPLSYFTRRLFNHDVKGMDKHTLMNRLVSSGLLKKSESLVIKNGRPPIFYSITERGHKLLDEIRS